MTILPPGVSADFSETAHGTAAGRLGTAVESRASYSSRALRPRRARLFLAVVLAGSLMAFAGTAAAAAEGPTQFTEADYATYSTLRLAKAVKEEKGMFAHDKAKRAALEVEFAKACADAGWTKERFEQIDEAVGSALSALDDPENAGEDVSKTTLATVKAHRKELADYDGLRQHARELVQEQAMAARRGAPPTPAQLAGTWVMDMDLTVAGMTEGMGDDLKKSARDELSKTLLAARYTFGPGDRLVATIQRPGPVVETQDGTYRLDGSTLIIKAKMGSRDREDKVTIGIKDGYLRIGMMGATTVFRRE